MVSPSALDWRAFACRPAAVLAVWALFCLVSLSLLPLTGAEPAGPDDYMRLLEVRDLLAGQSWWDVTQYRIDPPEGASMHWSRLVDLPLAAVAALFGETTALVVVPLAYLLAALFALRAIMLRLGFGPLAMALSLVILLLFPLLPGNFAPMRIDHHAPQAVLALWCAALLLQPSRLSAIFCGVLAAAWCVISLEGLPMVAVLAGLFGLAYLWGADRRLPFFLGALAIAALPFSLATRPVSAFALPFCDILLPGHMIGFGVAAAVAALIPFMAGQARAGGRLLALAAIPLASVPAAYLMLGECAANPFASLDPVLQQYWHGMITEGLPIWHQTPSIAAMLVWTLAIVGAGWWVAGKDQRFDQGHALGWTLLALMALAAGIYSLFVMRAGVVAQLLAIPFAAALLAHFLPRARAIAATLPRIAATFACFLLATPMLASGTLKPLDPVAARSGHEAIARSAMEGGACDYARLAALPQGHVLAPLDNGPEILGKSDHTIVMASYHRNQARMRDVVLAFTGNSARAATIARANGADYVVACSSEPDLAFYRSGDPRNFANMLFGEDGPHWLEPVNGFDSGSLRVFRVR